MLKVGAGFPMDVFSSRRDRVFDALGDQVLILPSAPTLVRPGGGEVAYRPDPELFYLTGSTEPGIVAVLRGGDHRTFLLFVSETDPSETLWTGERLGPEEASEIFDADEAFPLTALEEKLPEILRPHRTAAFRLGSHARVEAALREALEWSRARGARKGDGIRVVVDPGEILDSMRIKKGPEEIAAIRRAADMTVTAFREAMAVAVAGAGEWEVEAAFEHAVRRQGGSGPAFPTIVGSGSNACVLHYVDNAHRIADGSMILLDGGAEVGMYSGDVTRTFPAGGVFDARQRDLFDVVRRAHERALAACRPGGTVSEVHEAAREELASGLRALGVIEGDPFSEEGQAVLNRFFPHRTSHWLGLVVHDVGAYQSPDGPTTLEPGMVLTVEPGLYFPAGLEGPGAPFEGLGVRIEDDVLITDDGAEVLTRTLPVEEEGGSQPDQDGQSPDGVLS